MINLEEHKFFEFETKQDVVPLSVAQQAVAEASGITKGVNEFNDAVSLIKKAVDDMNDINLIDYNKDD